jgi:enhancing lycopene biosynthesis protein 2
VVLSGCGVFDGSEIHEAVLTLLALDRAQAKILCMAPNRPQADVIDHRTGKPTQEKRNVLTEAARIARGKIQDIAEVHAADLDGIILPGGFGAAKNLSTFAHDGADCKVDPEVTRLLREMHAADKPIAALCIAPAVLAALFGESDHPEITIGSDPGTARALETLGARHRNATVLDAVVDEKHKIVTSPCYMLDTHIADVAQGVECAVHALLALTEKKVARA